MAGHVRVAERDDAVDIEALIAASGCSKVSFAVRGRSVTS